MIGETDRRQAVRSMLELQHGLVVPVTDEMVDCVMAGLESERESR